MPGAEDLQAATCCESVAAAAAAAVLCPQQVSVYDTLHSLSRSLDDISSKLYPVFLQAKVIWPDAEQRQYTAMLQPCHVVYDSQNIRCKSGNSSSSCFSHMTNNIEYDQCCCQDKSTGGFLSSSS
jgi:hypothetical protein